jgi:beta-lactamase superfamily II metal-dependent hydrolase
MKKRLYTLASLAAALILAGCNGTEGNGPVHLPSGPKPEPENPEGEPTPGNPSSTTPETVTVGKTLPAWTEGCLDIHHINTGRGESAFYILPDGTTMLIDAAGSLLKTSDKPPTPAKPNDQITSGAVIIDYVKAYMPEVCKGTLDYMLLSHFHGDHMGSWSTSVPKHAGGFYMNGYTEVGAEIPVAKFLDRGTRTNRKASDMIDSGGQGNYDKFIAWAKKTNASMDERFIAGRNDQIVLTHTPEKYSTFSVRNIAANGDVWTGSGSTAISQMPAADELLSWSEDKSAALPYENTLSCVMTISYGSFDYFCGGDIQYNGRSSYGYKDIEMPISKVVKKVEVMKASHHGTANTNGKEILAALKPDAIIVPVWRNVQPNPDTVERMYDANSACNIFTTNLTDDNKVLLSKYLSKFKGTQGHVVVRVHPGGTKYYIYVLGDDDLNRTVKKIYGPYNCK